MDSSTNEPDDASDAELKMLADASNKRSIERGDGSNLARPVPEDHSGTAESLGLLGAGQGYPQTYK